MLLVTGVGLCWGVRDDAILIWTIAAFLYRAHVSDDEGEGQILAYSYKYPEVCLWCLWRGYGVEETSAGET
jgi:hypothetical protein